MALTLGTILYVAILIINAMAVLSEDRFLVRIGWSSASPPTATAGFSQPYATAYDQAGYAAQQDIGVKARLINLISAVRTLMRIPLIGVNLIVIGYELLLGS
ncbi:Yos1-like protein [Fomitopsis betulina]|nr:Yos1-like protein [Fomitopsis betulina]